MLTVRNSAIAPPRASLTKVPGPSLTVGGVAGINYAELDERADVGSLLSGGE